MHKTTQYWAAAHVKNISDEMLEKADKYYTYCNQSGRLDLWRRSWLYYYKPLSTGALLNSTGEQGELTSLSVNNYRNLLSHLETLTTQQKAAFDPRATNTDVKSQAQVILAAGLLDYYMREKHMDRYINKAVKDSLIFGEAFLRAEWDTQGGETYGQTPSGATIYQGDMKYSNYNPLDVIRDYSKTDPNQEDWYILRTLVNKYNLAAQYPELQSEILSDEINSAQFEFTTTLNFTQEEDTDNIYVYTLIHKPNTILPQGRYTQILGNNTVIQDGPLPYKDTNLYRIAPDETTGSIFGYTVGFDLMPVQEAQDILFSSILTNNATFAVQNILVPKGHDISTSQLAGGLSVVEYDKDIGKPEALQLTGTAPETFTFLNLLNQVGETISGVNSVARGQPDASLKSGAALALVQSMAVQFSQNLQRSYAALIEDVGTGTINILKDFAAVPRVAAIAGKSNRPLMKSFVGEDLSHINRVVVDMGNPMSNTTAGKTNLAESLVERNLIDNADQYIQVVTTGRLEPVIEGKQAELLLIKSENELLANGEAQYAIITDMHAQHILEHKTVLASPEARRDPAIMQTTLNHIQEHIDFLKTADPALLSLIHQQPVGGQVPQPPQQGGNIPQQMGPIPQPEPSMPNQPSAPQGTDPQTAAVIEQQASLNAQNG